jgi:hypothetical protein
MEPIGSLDDLYAAVRDLIVELKDVGETRLSKSLDYRMREVPWTTWSELAEELQNVLRSAPELKQWELPAATDEKIGRILLAIEGFLGAAPPTTERRS